MIRQGLPRSPGRASTPPRARAQGCAEGSPDPYPRRGLVGRPSGPDHDCSGISRHDSPLLHGSSRQQHLFTGNRPDEPRQLPRHRCHRPSRWLAPFHQTEQPLVKPMLRLPGDRPNRRRHPIVSLANRLAHPWLPPGVPRRLHQGPAHVAVAGARDPALTAAPAAGVLRRHQPHVRTSTPTPSGTGGSLPPPLQGSPR